MNIKKTLAKAYSCVGPLANGQEKGKELTGWPLSPGNGYYSQKHFSPKLFGVIPGRN
jgi:hypothetical protein